MGIISTIIAMDDRGRILIPKSIRDKVKSKYFRIKLRDDGSIVLEPLLKDALAVAGKHKGILVYEDFEELEEKQEEYIRKMRGL